MEQHHWHKPMPFCREYASLGPFFVDELNRWMHKIPHILPSCSADHLQDCCKLNTEFPPLKQKKPQTQKSKLTHWDFWLCLQHPQQYWCFLQPRLSLFVRASLNNLGTLPICFYVMKYCKAHRLQKSFRRMWDLGAAWIVLKWWALQTQSVPVCLPGLHTVCWELSSLRGIEENTQNKKAQMESGIFAGLVLQSL